MIKSNNDVEIGADEHNGRCALRFGHSEPLSFLFAYLDRQGVDALIKELEEVREKLPKPKIVKRAWLNIYKNHVSGSYPSEDEANRGNVGARIECREISWEVEEE